MNRLSPAKSILSIALLALMVVVMMPRAALAACANPTGTAGEILYNTDYNVLQFCDNTNWVSMAGGASGGGTAASTTGAVQYNGGSSAFAGDSTNFVWDSTNKRLGIGIASPTQALDVVGKVTSNGLMVKLTTGLPAPTGGTGTGPNFNTMIVAFAATSCPGGWTEYTPARGRFLRGIDPSGSTTVDPAGTRTPGNQQADLTKISVTPEGSVVAGNLQWAPGSGNTLRFETSGTYGSNGSTGVETRPKNVAVIYCQYTGTGGSGGAAPSSGTSGYVQISGGSGLFTSDSVSPFFWDGTNHRLGIGTATPTVALDVNGTAKATSFNIGYEPHTCCTSIPTSTATASQTWSGYQTMACSAGKKIIFFECYSQYPTNGTMTVGEVDPTGVQIKCFNNGTTSAQMQVAGYICANVQ